MDIFLEFPQICFLFCHFQLQNHRIVILQKCVSMLSYIFHENEIVNQNLFQRSVFRAWEMPFALSSNIGSETSSFLILHLWSKYIYSFSNNLISPKPQSGLACLHIKLLRQLQNIIIFFLEVFIIYYSNYWRSWNIQFVSQNLSSFLQRLPLPQW